MTTETVVKIARCEAFYRRVEFFAIKAAIAKLNEETPEPADVLLAQSILDGMENMVIWSLAILTNPTIMAGAHDDDGKTIVDNDLEFTVNSIWSAFAV